MLSAPLLLPSYYSSWPSLVSDFGFDMPRSSIDQTDSAVNFELAVPGFKDDEVHVSVDGNLLRVHAEHQDRRHDEQRDAQGRVISRSKYQSSSSIHESFRLPSGLRLDNMTKEVSNGMLKVSIPKLAITDRPQQQQLQQQQPQQQQQQPQQQLQGSQSQPQQQPQGSQAGDKQQELVGQAQQEHNKRHREGEVRPWSSSLMMMDWPPHIETHESGNQLEYIISLPNVRKENVRLNVEHNQLYLSIVEHDEGHTFDNCGSCVSQRQRGDEFEKRQGSTQRGGIGHDSQQRQKDELVRGECSRYSERSCTFRLPYGTACEDVEARFDNNKLVVRVQRKRRGWGGVNIQ